MVMALWIVLKLNFYATFRNYHIGFNQYNVFISTYQLDDHKHTDLCRKNLITQNIVNLHWSKHEIITVKTLIIEWNYNTYHCQNVFFCKSYWSCIFLQSDCQKQYLHWSNDDNHCQNVHFWDWKKDFFCIW